jgi:hypothetical protein
MKRFVALFALATLVTTPLAAKPAPVNVTRFHTEQTLPRLKGAAIIVELAPGSDPASLEDGLWREAVARELTAAGFGSATSGAADGIAQVMVERETIRRENRRGPVSVGVGGQTGGWGSGLGVGLGFNLGGGPKDVVLTRLSVRIRDRVSGEALWEGRAETRESAKAKDATPALTAPRLAQALFTGFPGTSGETITIK